MKVYMKRPVVSKVAQALLSHPDRDVQALARHLQAKAAQEPKFLTADELGDVLNIVNAWIEQAERNTKLDPDVLRRITVRVKSAVPKLASYLTDARKREAQGIEDDESGD